MATVLEDKALVAGNNEPPTITDSTLAPWRTTGGRTVDRGGGTANTGAQHEKDHVDAASSGEHEGTRRGSQHARHQVCLRVL
jgi:hypothetical protein